MADPITVTVVVTSPGYEDHTVIVALTPATDVPSVVDPEPHEGHTPGMAM